MIERKTLVKRGSGEEGRHAVKMRKADGMKIAIENSRKFNKGNSDKEAFDSKTEEKSW